MSERESLENNKAPKKKKKNIILRILSGIGSFIAMFVMVGIMTGCIVAVFLTTYIFDTMENVDAISLENIEYNYTTIVYAENSTTEEFVEITRLHQSENRIWVDYSDISPHLVNAAIAIEDKRFPTHNGVDWSRTIASAIDQFIPILPGSPGGSTITQQLIKNATGDNAVLVERKVREIFRALDLEQNYSKEQIMEAYLNTIALGNNTNGVEAAANLYFGKSASEVTVAEAAAIVSITQNPSKWNPFVFPENNEIRRETVLYEMHTQGYLTSEEYEDALAEDIQFNTEENIVRIETIQNWFVDEVMEQVINDLAEKYNYTYSYAETQLLNGGYRIYTTMDVEIQDYLEDAFTNMDNFPAVYNEVYPEGAFVIMEPNGKVVALVGSNREKDGARLFNRATQALRHPGSTIKPIASYAPAVETNLIHWSTIIEDSPVTINTNGVDVEWPRNHYGSYLGEITVDQAIQRSTNTLPVKIVSMLTPQYSYDFLKNRLGMNNLVDYYEENGQIFNDINLSGMALGGLTHGVTVMEMTGAFQIFANGGTFTEPYVYTRVEDSEGNIILENNTVPIRAISTETATVMNKLLQRVTGGPWGTGVAARLPVMPTAGKTGTSDNDYNQWFIGLTPYYVAACWLGYDLQETINYGIYPPPTIWKNIMEPLHAELEYKDFPVSENTTQATYCTVTGNLATSICDSTMIGWYKNSNLPQPCLTHEKEDEDAEAQEGEASEDGEESESSSDSSSSSDDDNP